MEKELKLGILYPVKLRDIWEHEERDFTPWLAKELAKKENLKRLLGTIGGDINLESVEKVETEKTIGQFRADIVCKNEDDSLILIENQFKKTDHKHLGQLTTYVANLDATTIIWIAEEFTEEHRKALDWLNKNTDVKFRFFGLEIKLWRIDDSLPAPKFNLISLNLISQPPDWSSVISRTKLRPKYYSALFEYLKQNSEIPNYHPTKDGYVCVPLKKDVKLYISINTRTNKLTARICLFEKMREKYEDLNQQKDTIEESFGEDLVWQDDRKTQSIIKLKSEKDANIENKNNWPEYHAWFKEKLETFIKVFQPIVEKF